MSALNLEAIEHRWQAATPGPWILWTGCSWRRFGGPDQSQRPHIEPTIASDGHPDLIISQEDASAIASAPTDIAALVAEVRKLRTEIDDMFHAYHEEKENGGPQ